MLAKGLSSTTPNVMLKTAELIQELMKRLRWVGWELYGSMEKAQPFLKHYMALLPSLDSELSLFKKVTIFAIEKKPLEGEVKKETPTTETMNLQIGGMEVEDAEGGEEGEEKAAGSPVPTLLTMLQRITTLLVHQISLFHIDITHYHPDILPLFTPINDTVFLFSVPESLSLSLLSFLIQLAPSLGHTLLVGKPPIRPLFALLTAVLPERNNHKTMVSRIESLLLTILRELGLLAGIPFAEAFLHFVLRTLTPGMIPYFADSVQDLMRQRLVFLTRNHAFHEETPLFYHAFLWSLFKPKTVGSPFQLLWLTQLLLLSNPSVVPSVLSLTQRYIREAMGEEEKEKEKEKANGMNESNKSTGATGTKLLGYKLSDEVLQTLQRIVSFWSDPQSFSQSVSSSSSSLSVYQIDIQSTVASLQASWDAAAASLFASVQHHALLREQIEPLVPSQPLLSLVFAFAGSPLHSESLLSTLRFLAERTANVENELLLMLLAILHDTDWLASRNPRFLSPAAAQSLLFSSLFCDASLASLWQSRVSDADFASLLALSLQPAYSSLWLAPHTAAPALLTHLFELPAKAAAHQFDRSLAELLLHHLESPVAVLALTLLQPVLFAEEKIAVVSFILERADDPAILAQLGKAQQPWTLPLDSTLLSSLLDALPRVPLAAKLLFDALHPLVDSYSADVVALLPSSLLDACFSHFDDALYRNLLRLVLQLQPAFHSSFLSSLTAFSQSPFYASFFAELAALVEICLARSSSLAASLPALQSSPFLQDLLHSLALSDVSPSQFRLLHRLTQLPALHSVFAQLDIPSLCKQALHASVLQTDRLRALLAAASLASDADRAIAIVLLRSLQAIGKTAAQAAADEPIASPQCVLLVLEACDAHKSALEQVLRKQPELYARLVRTLLRNRLGDAAAIALLTRLVETAVRAELAIPEASAGHLLTLLTTHSQFDAMIRRAAEEMTAHSDAEYRKRWLEFDGIAETRSFSYRFISLLTQLINLSPQDCSAALFTRLLSMYGCSLSPQDRLLRATFRALDLAGVFALEDVGYLFGSFAPMNSNGTVQRASTWMLEAVSGLRLRKSVEHFPREWREEEKMEIEDGGNGGNGEKGETENEENGENEGIEWKDNEDEEEKEERNRLEMQEEKRRNSVDLTDSKQGKAQFDPSIDCLDALLLTPFSFSLDSRDCVMVVDPSFYLPLLHYYLYQDHVNVQAYLAHGVAGYLIACLTSENQIIRQTASCLLQRFVDLVIDASFFEQKQILMLFLKLQNSIINPALRLPSLIASFVNESIYILQRPENPLYSVISRFWLSHPVFYLFDTPLFEKLLATESLDYRQLRGWCMRYILRGVQTKRDFHILARRHVFPELQSLALSSRTDAYIQKVVIAILQRLVAIPAVTRKLVAEAGILPWLTLMVRQAKQRVLLYAIAAILEEVEKANEPHALLNELNLLQRLLLSLSEGTEAEYQADVNRLLLPCLRVLQSRIERLGQAVPREIDQLVVRLWRLCVEAVWKLMEARRKPSQEAILENCELSSDDFYLLCAPRLRDLNACFEDCCECLRRIKTVLPFSVEKESQCEGMVERLLF